MKLSSCYAEILKLDVQIFRTQDISALLGASLTHASHILRRLSADGLVQPIKRGTWALTSLSDPFAAAHAITSPNPCYISLQSALYYHGLISQIPRQIYLVSLARSTTTKTTLGTFSIHHINPNLFTGFNPHGSQRINIADPEKALIDFFYFQQSQPQLFKSLPELDLPSSFSIAKSKKMLCLLSNENRRNMILAKIKKLVTV